MAVQTISHPEDKIVNINIEPGQALAFDFDISTASFERAGNDLTVSMDGGGQLVLSNFFVGDVGGSLPALQLEDGTEIASADFLAAMNPDLDVAPAADSVSSNGINSYSDGAGDLVNGLNGSEDLGSIFWANASSARDESLLGSGGLGGAGAGGGGTTPPVPGNLPYTARAVLYTDNGAADSFKIRLDAGKNDGDVERIESQYGVVDVTSLTLNADGTYSFATSAVNGSGNVYDYITIYYNDGTSRTIQVIINQDGSYNSAAEDAANPPGSPVEGEWHTENKNGDTGTGRQTSDGHDEIWMDSLNTTYNGGDNFIDTGAGIDQVYIAAGVQAAGGDSNTVRTGFEDGNSISAGSVAATNNGLNLLESGQISVNSTGLGIAAMSARSGGTNTLIAGNGGIDVSKMGADYSKGLEASGGTNSLTAEGDVTVALNGGSTDARGVSAETASSYNYLTSNQGDINVLAGMGNGSNLSGVYAENSGQNVLKAENGTINVEALGDGSGSWSNQNYARGVYAQGGGKNSLSGQDIVLSASEAYEAFGVHAFGGTNTLSASDTLTIVAENAAGSAIGAKAENGGRNLINAENLISITASEGGNKTTSALSVQGEGLNRLISQGDIELVAANSLGRAVGMEALQSDPKKVAWNDVAAKQGTVSLDVSGKAAYGMSATDNTVGNTIRADNVEIDVRGDNIAYGMHATASAPGISGGVNNVYGSTVNITVDGNGAVYGMYAENSGTNYIHSADNSAVTVSIVVPKGAFAMFSDGVSSSNYILGSDHNDTVMIQGDVGSSDFGKNKIDTGKGDDTIILDGTIGRGALQIDAGDGYDTLVLRADSITEFNANYQAWLSDTGPGGTINWDAMSVECVHVQVGGDVNIGDLEWMNDVFADKGVDFILEATEGSAMELMGQFVMGAGDDSFSLVGDISFQSGLIIDGGDGMDTLNLGSLEGAVDLGSLAEFINGFEVIDLTGGDGTFLTIDSLLTDLGIDENLQAGDISHNSGNYDLANGTVLRITGDGNSDQVNVDGSVWKQGQTVDYDGVTYYVYTNDSMTDQYLLVQADIIYHGVN